MADAGTSESRGTPAQGGEESGSRGAAVVPLLYALQGMPYFLVQAASNTYFTAMGAAPSVVGRISSDLTLPWMLKPLWSPLVDLVGTKRRWLLGAALAVLCAVVALALATRQELWLEWTVGACVALAIPGIWFWPQQWPEGSAWLGLLLVGALCTGVAYVLYFRLVAKTGGARTLSVTYVIPLVANLIGVVLLDEAITWQMLWGGILILMGTALANGLLPVRRKG